MISNLDKTILRTLHLSPHCTCPRKQFVQWQGIVKLNKTKPKLRWSYLHRKLVGMLILPVSPNWRSITKVKNKTISFSNFKPTIKQQFGICHQVNALMLLSTLSGQRFNHSMLPCPLKTVSWTLVKGRYSEKDILCHSGKIGGFLSHWKMDFQLLSHSNKLHP